MSNQRPVDITPRILAAPGAGREIDAVLRHLFTRLAVGVAVVAGVVVLTFLLLHAAPGNPVDYLLGPTATPGQITAARHSLGLDRPLPAQFTAWLARFATGDWGTSIATGRPVRDLIATAWPETAWLVGLSLLLSCGLGVIVGAAQAARPGSRTDAVLSIGTVTLYAVPGYWLGLMLIMLGTYQLKLFPAFGAAGYDADFLRPLDQLLDRARHLTLPLLTLTLIGIGGMARFARGAMVDVRGEAFITTARAKGLPPARVRRHILRNALIPVVTLLGLSLPALFSGAVFIEAVFAWPGVGRVLVEAVQARDYPVVMAATAISAALVVLGNLLADLAVAAL
ncbi:MAG TPA: ABC transporter permease, partial [Gemmatimonadales bacterium]|nr:ABC transporter permease [Gemmatimonadales bacterium]